MTWLLALTLSTANASWLTDFCAKHLAVEDPYPYAEESTMDLLHFYKGDKKMLDEIVYRYRNGLMTADEVAEFWKRFGGKDE